jgi:hypothetical protein
MLRQWGRREFSSALAGSIDVLLLELGSMETIEVEVGSRYGLWIYENRCDEAVTKPCNFVPGNFSHGKAIVVSPPPWSHPDINQPNHFEHQALKKGHQQERILRM